MTHTSTPKPLARSTWMEGESLAHKMTLDRRQPPQSILLHLLKEKTRACFWILLHTLEKQETSGEKFFSVTSKCKRDQNSPLAGLQSGGNEGRLVTSENLRSTCLELHLYTLWKRPWSSDLEDNDLLSTQVRVSPEVRKYMKGTFLPRFKYIFNLSRCPDK